MVLDSYFLSLSVQALFMAYGPSFKQQLRIDEFDNIEVYNLMAGASQEDQHLHVVSRR